MPSLSSLINFGLPAATSLVGGAINRGAAGSATSALTAGGQQGIDTITRGQQAAQTALTGAVNQQTGLFDPAVKAGQGATATLSTGVQPGGSLVQPFSWTPAELQNDPAYQFRLQQGMKAINAQGAASGNRFSGATLKSLADYNAGTTAQYENQDYGQAFNTYQYNQQTQLGALQNLASQGLTAAGQESAALGQYGTNTANLATGSAKAIADLQTQIASAQAGGDIAKANALQNTLNGITQGVQQGQVLNSILKPPQTPGGPTTSTGIDNPGATEVNSEGEIVPAGSSGAATQAITGAATTGAGATGAALASGGGAAALTPAVDVAIPELGIGGAGAAGSAAAASGEAAALGGEAAAGGAEAASAGGEAAAAAAGGEAGGGILGAASAFLTNPWTIGIGAALIGGAAIIKALQTRGVADDFVKHFQDPLVNSKGTGTLNKIVDGFDKALASGQLSKAQAQQVRTQTASLIQQYETAGAQFAKKGDKQASVWNQAQRTMAEAFGGQVDAKGHNNSPDWSKILGKMQSEIDALPAA